MDTDWTFSSCSWLWEEDATFKNSCSGLDWSREEDKAFENALAMYYNDADRWDKIALAVPGKTIEDIKLHYEALSHDVVAIESNKVLLPPYPRKVSVRRKKKKSSEASVQRGTPWTEEEHRQFLYGLQRFGRGDWKSISRYSVRTKSNSQVASHAQKYFKRLKANQGKRPSINDITSVHPESLLALEKATNSCMPQKRKEKSTSTGNKKLLPTNLKKASNNDGNQLLLGYSMEPSTHVENHLLLVCPNEASNSADNQLSPLYPREASGTGDQVLPGYSKKASTNAESQLFPECPKEDSTNAGDQQLPGYPKEASSNIGNQLLPGYPKEASASFGNQLLPVCPKKVSTNEKNQLFFRYPQGQGASTDVENPLLPPTAFAGMSAHPFSGHAIASTGTSAALVPTCSMFTSPFASHPVLVPGPSVEMSAYHPPAASVQDGGVPPTGTFGIPSTSYLEIIDLDMFVFPHFLD